MTLAQGAQRRALVVHVNGTTHAIDADPQMPLLWVLRDVLNLTGTKYGCGVGQCGACTVMVEGIAVRACVKPVGDVVGKQVSTIENQSNATLQTLREAWIEHQVPQCGYCQSGMLMAALDLLAKNMHPTQEDIARELTNICRCGTYPRIERAILDAASRLNPTSMRVK